MWLSERLEPLIHEVVMIVRVDFKSIFVNDVQVINVIPGPWKYPPIGWLSTNCFNIVIASDHDKAVVQFKDCAEDRIVSRNRTSLPRSELNRI